MVLSRFATLTLSLPSPSPLYLSPLLLPRLQVPGDKWYQRQIIHAHKTNAVACRRLSNSLLLTRCRHSVADWLGNTLQISRHIPSCCFVRWPLDLLLNLTGRARGITLPTGQGEGRQDLHLLSPLLSPLLPLLLPQYTPQPASPAPGRSDGKTCLATHA